MCRPDVTAPLLRDLRFLIEFGAPWPPRGLYWLQLMWLVDMALVEMSQQSPQIAAT